MNARLAATKRLMLPMWIAQAYLGFTVILYFFGPLAWDTKDPVLLCAFLLLVQVALYAGYRTSMNRFRREEAPLHGWERSDRLAGLLPAMIVVSTVFAVLNTTRYLGLTTVSVQSLTSRAWEGLLNPSAGYVASLNGGEFGGSLLPFLSTLLAPVLWATIPLSLLHFRSLKTTSRVLAVILMTLETVRWIGMGTNKGIFDLVIICGVVVFIKRTQDYLKRNAWPERKGVRHRGTFLVVMVLAVLAIAYFSNAIDSRVNLNSGSRGAWSNFTASQGGVNINENSILMSICPSILRSTLVYLTSYLTQGYFALSLALPLPWTPMFGIGNSYFLMQKLGSFANVDFFQFTYQTKLGLLGWNALANWHSAYVWLANDVSFIGVPLLMFLLGFAAAEAVKDAVILGDPIAGVMLCLVAIMVFYLPANNQVLSYPSTFMAFWVCGAAWLVQRRNRRGMLASRRGMS